MKNRHYIIDEEPRLFTLMEIVTENMADDVEPLEEFELVNLARLKKGSSLPLGNCEIRRVI
jgi:hypothetical protein